MTAKARVTKRTRTPGLVEYEETDTSEGLVAKLFSTSTVLRGRRPRGDGPATR